MQAPWTYFLSQAGPGQQRGLIEPGHGRGGDQHGSAPPTRGQGIPLRQAGSIDRRRPGGSRRRSATGTLPPGCAGPPGKRPGPAAWSHRTGPSPARPAGGPRTSRPATARRAFCRSCWTRSAGAAGISFLLKRPGGTPGLTVRQVQAARAGTLRVMLLGPDRDLPHHRRPRAARLRPFSASRHARRCSAASSSEQGLAVRRRRRRWRSCTCCPRRRPESRLQLPPQVSDHRLQRRDPLRLRLKPRRLLTDQPITRILQQRHMGSAAHDSPGNHTQPSRQHRTRRRTVTMITHRNAKPRRLKCYRARSRDKQWACAAGPSIGGGGAGGPGAVRAKKVVGEGSGWSWWCTGRYRRGRDSQRPARGWFSSR